MKTLLTQFFLMGIFCASMAQEKVEEPKKKWVEFSGHVRFEAFIDSYNSVAGRDGDVYLYPMRAKFDDNGVDINKNMQTKMYSGQSRFRAKINGPDAFGAKINGMFEFDLMGVSANFELTPRIRHLFMNADWGKTQLTLGYTWHPLFALECYPKVLSMGAGIPFVGFGRSTQAKVTHKLTDNLIVVAGLFSHSDFRSSGPYAMQKNAGIPDAHGQLKYVNNKLAAGIIGGYRVLKPRLVTDANFVTNKTIGAFDVAGFIKLNATDDLTLKLYGIYGQNMSTYTMIGGFGASQNPTQVDDYDYTNIETMAAWADVNYKYNAWSFGLFAGYSANLGTSDDDFYIATSYARGVNVVDGVNVAIDNIMRVSPYFNYTSGKVSVGIEYMYTAANYMDLASDSWENTSADPTVANSRIQVSSKYTF